MTRAAELGWEELKNGELLERAERAGFKVLVTCERNIKHQQNLRDRKIAIVVLPAGRWPAVREQIQEMVAAVDDAQPGTYFEYRIAALLF